MAEHAPEVLLPARAPDSELDRSSDSESVMDEAEAAADWSEEEEACQDLFSSAQLGSAALLVAHVKQAHGLDLCALRVADEYAWIRLVNYCRRRFLVEGAAAGAIVSEVLQAANGGECAWARDDSLLAPVLADDALLYAFEELELLPAGGGGEDEPLETLPVPAEERVRILEAELKAARAKVRELMEEDTSSCSGSDSGSGGEERGGQGQGGQQARAAPRAARSRKEVRSDDYYFDSYGHLGILEEMLRDRPRTEAYRDALDALLATRRGAVVYDIGCGTGILSLFAARAGAGRVVGVEYSKVAELAERLVCRNGYESVIEVVRARVEELALPPQSADIIVSEWMGYGLLFESMLDSVIVARDRYLKPGGLIVPCRASIFVQGQSLREAREFWHDVYGFDFSQVLEGVVSREPLVDAVEDKTIVTDRQLVFDIDIETVTKEQLDFSRETKLTAMHDTALTGIVITFDTEMFKGGNVLTTACEAKPTHWVQTVLPLRTDVSLKAGEQINVLLKYKRNRENPREIDITLILNADNIHVYTLR